MPSDLFDGLLDWFAERSFLADALWQTTLLSVVGLCAARLLAARPARAHLVLVASLAAAAVTPLATYAARTLGLGFLAAAATTPVPFEGTDSFARAAAVEVPFAELVERVLLVLWAGAVVVLSSRLALGHLRSRRVAARVGRPASDHLRRTVVDAARHRGLARAVEVLEADAGLAPCLWAWSRPARLFLPSSLPPDQLRAAVHHELGHLERRDHVASLVVDLCSAWLCWHPAAWIARRRVAALAEQACDEWALASGVAPQTMARTLLAAVPIPAATAPLGQSLRRDRRLLEQRIEHVFRPSTSQPCCGGAWSAAVWIGLGLLGLAAAMAQPATAIAAAGDVAGPGTAGVTEGAGPWTERVAELTALGVDGVVVQPAELDLGVVAPASTPTGKVWLVNASVVDRRVLDVTTGCGCTRVRGAEGAVVPAGGVLELDVEQDAEKGPDASKTKLVTLRIEGQEPLQFPVTSRTAAVPTLQAAPDAAPEGQEAEAPGGETR